jgi:hypothetical protein
MMTEEITLTDYKPDIRKHFTDVRSSGDEEIDSFPIYQSRDNDDGDWRKGSRSVYNSKRLSNTTYSRIDLQAQGSA